MFARDYPHDYPEVEAVLMVTATGCGCAKYRCACSCVGAASSINGTGKSAYYMVKVLLAIFVGLARRRN